MNTPVLTQEQQRKTLVGKKGPTKGLRHVLTQPYDTYWPVLKDDEGGVLKKQLRDLLPPLKRQKSSVPWSQLRKMKKEERLLIKKANQEKDEISPLNKSVVTGINAVTRGLERKVLCSVLLDSNVESIVVKHIITMSVNGNIPTVLIPFLKVVTLETIGFSSAVFALKNDVKNSTDHHFRALHEKISELSASFVRPKLLIQSFPKEVFKDVKTTKKNPAQSLDGKNVKKTIPTFSLSSNVYLYRSSTKERIFVPERSNLTIISASSSKDWGDFIPLGEDTNLKFSSDLILNKNVGKEGVKAERYMDFCDEIGSSNEKISLTNGSGEIFGFLDTGSSEVINKNSNNEVLEKAESNNNNKKIKRSATINFSYVPLKVKRIQGSSNRIKSTKAPKSKKK